MDLVAILGRLALLLAISVLPGLALTVLLELDRIGVWVAESWRDRRSTERPTGPPVERIAADLRRISTMLTDPRPMSAVRRTGILAAYDNRLVAACAALDVPHDLDRTDGMDREIERLRIETALEACGLVIRGSSHDRPGR